MVGIRLGIVSGGNKAGIGWIITAPTNIAVTTSNDSHNPRDVINTTTTTGAYTTTTNASGDTL